MRMRLRTVGRKVEQGRCPVPCGNNITILTEPVSPAMGTQASVVLQNIQGKTHLNEPLNYPLIQSHSLYATVWNTQVTDIHSLVSLPLQPLEFFVNIKLSCCRIFFANY